jgi:dTDP-4-dehydrorhamnose reductase
MLGHKLCQLLPQMGHEVVGTVRQDPAELADYGEVYSHCRLIGPVDVLDDAQLDATLADQEPDAIINAVGVVKQLKEANNALLSVGINSYLPHKLAQLAARYEARLVHISTDCVFSGQKGAYREDDPSDAEDLYGRSKFLGETDETETAAVTLRTSFIGRELHRPTHGLIEWFLSQQGQQIKGFTRAIYTGLTSIELVRVIERVIREHDTLRGVYQVASQPITKYDLLQLAREAMGVDVRIEPDESFFCDRSMVMDRFVEATGYQPPTWAEMVRQLGEDPTPYDRYFT